MLTQTQVQIYLENQRGLFQTESFRSFRTFNFDEYRAEGREAFGNLLAVNDETLLAQCNHIIKVVESCKIILIPLVGGIEVNLQGDATEFVDSGEVLAFFASPDQTYVISNPYPQEAINYLQIRICSEHSNHKTQLTQFDLLYKNTLQTVFIDELDEVNIYLGKYGGREEGVFKSDLSSRGVFAFVIEGAFEVQNRLLEKRDGLSVSFADEIEFEALSNDAVILVVEV